LNQRQFKEVLDVIDLGELQKVKLVEEAIEKEK
jgi:hypothetical protein